MGNQKIDEREKWTKFVNKLAAKTKADKIKWNAWHKDPSRKCAIGPIFGAEIVPEKMVAVYRYSYEHYTDVDIYDVRDDIAIEFVDENGIRIWQLPEVGARYALIDAIEFKAADAQETLDAFLSDDDE